MKNDHTLVNILGVGAPKSGTTWLFNCLDEHFDVKTPKKDMPNNKELYFFDRYYHNGFDWYHSLFDADSSISNKLEITATYLSDVRIPKRIYDYNPGVKILICLRNPIERAYSHHKMLAGGGIYGDPDLVFFENALKLNPAYIEFGYFGKQIENYLKYFKKESIHIIFFEEICKKPEKVVDDVCDFLSLSRFRPRVLKKKIYESSKKFKIRTETKFKYLNKIKRGFFRNDSTIIPPMERETRIFLKKIFYEDIKKVERLTGYNLSHWE